MKGGRGSPGWPGSRGGATELAPTNRIAAFRLVSVRREAVTPSGGTSKRTKPPGTFEPRGSDVAFVRPRVLPVEELFFFRWKFTSTPQKHPAARHRDVSAGLFRSANVVQRRGLSADLRLETFCCLSFYCEDEVARPCRPIPKKQQQQQQLCLTQMLRCSRLTQQLNVLLH